jgi:hypothetical protein
LSCSRRTPCGPSQRRRGVQLRLHQLLVDQELDEIFDRRTEPLAADRRLATQTAG